MRYIEEIIEDVRNGKPLSSRDEEIVAIAYIRGKYEGERKSKINIIEVINKIREEITDAGYDHYFECGEYIGEEVVKQKIISINTVNKIIDKWEKLLTIS